MIRNLIMLAFFTKTVRRKLITVLSFVLILTIVVGAIGGIGAVSIRSVTQSSLNAGFRINELVQKAKLEIQEVQRLALYYLVSYETIGPSSLELIADSIPEHIDTFESHLLDIEALADAPVYRQEDFDIESAISHADAYEETVLHLIELIGQRGVVVMDEVGTEPLVTLGYVGSMWTNFQAMEEEIELRDDEELKDLLASLKLAERSYLLFGSRQFRAQVLVFGDDIQDHVSTDEDQVDPVQALIEGYLSDFGEVDQLNTEIQYAFDDINSEIIQINRELDTMTTVTLEQVANAEHTILHQVDLVLYTIGFVIVVALLFGGALAMGITRSITQPLGRIIRTTKEITVGGDLSQRVDVNSQDEVGVLARAFNNMAIQLQATLSRAAEERDLLRTLIDSIPDYIIVRDLEGMLLICNETYAQLVNAASPDELTGKAIVELQPNWSGQYEAEDAAQTNVEEQFVDQDGDTQWVSITKSLLKDSQGHARGSVIVARNVTKRKQTEAEFIQLQQDIIDAQKNAIKELSTPVIPVLEGILVMPLIGTIDSDRGRDITRTLLNGISVYGAQVVLLDVTGVPIVDSGVADHLDKTIQAARLKGAQIIITGVSDAVAETIVDLGINWEHIKTLRNLQAGLIAAIRHLGIEKLHI
jgi:PAS domain S-box-containing protein